MRDYKFRGQRKDNLEWVYGSLEIEYDGTTYINYWLQMCTDPSVNLWEPIPQCYAVIPETLGQSSEYKDMTGKELFEHDIVNVSYGTGKVVYNAGCFMIEWLDDKEANMELLAIENFKTGHRREDLIVIGNIHDNSELLQLQN